MKLRPELVPQPRPLYKTISQKHSSAIRSSQTQQITFQSRAAKLRSKIKTQTADANLLVNLTGLAEKGSDSRELFQAKSLRRPSKSRSNSIIKSRSNSRSHKLLLEKGKTLYKGSQMDEAITIFKQLLLQESKPQVLFYLGSAFLNKQQYDKTIYYLKELLRRDPSFSKDSYLLLSIAHKKVRQFTQALNVLQKAIVQFGQFQQGYLYIAKLFMKLKKFDNAIQSFKKCLQLNPKSTLAHIGLGDTLRSKGRIQEAIDHYTQSLKQGSKYNLVCLMKRMSAYYQTQKYSEAQMDTDELLASKVNSAEVFYFKGMLLLERDTTKAAVYFEEALLLNNVVMAVTKSLEQLVKIRINRKDFYEAMHQIARISHLHVNNAYLSTLTLFVQGVLDGVKKRYKESITKLEQVIDEIKQPKKKSCGYIQIINQTIHVYLAYAYFCNQGYSKALENYNICKQISDSLKYNKSICEGIILQNRGFYAQARTKFQQAKLYLDKIEPFFYKAVNFIQEYYLIQRNEDYFGLALNQLKQGERIHTNNSLYYFYFAMLLLYRHKPQLYLILKAVEKSQDNIAEYYFVKAIIYCQNGNYEEGLSDFTNALLVDPQGTEFLKQRSKCLYMLNRYEQAIIDIKKCIQKHNKDYEAKLLLCFYLYALENYDLALDFLLQATQCDNNESTRIKTFIQSLHFRLHNYQKAGLIGYILNSIIKDISVEETEILNLDKFIATKQLLGEFQTCHLLCLKGIALLYSKNYPLSSGAFHEALQQVKNNLQLESDQASIDSQNQLRIYEVKFNMIILTICEKDYVKAATLTKMLIEDTQMTLLVEQLKCLQQHLEKAVAGPQSELQQLQLFLFEGKMNLLSQDFPVLNLDLGNNCQLIIRPILFFPEKLNFNITPELNEDMLRCFSIDKIQDRPQPPWIVRDQSNIFFTDNIDMKGSVCVSSSAAGQTQKGTRQKLKLNESVEKKLNRIINGEEEE